MMIFPSEAYQELCAKNQKALKWEPKEGDWVRTQHDGIQVLKTDDGSGYLVWHIGRTYPDLEEEMYLSGDYAEEIKKKCVWLPRLDQLMEMLEEKGYDWLLEVGALRDKDERYEAVLYGLCTKSTTAVKIRVSAPDSATALLKAYLEVVSQEGKEE